MCTCLWSKNLCLINYYNKSTKSRLYFHDISTKYDDDDEDDEDNDEYKSFHKINTSIKKLMQENLRFTPSVLKILSSSSRTF